ncbi:15086_t:CDS:2 [Cetraspora pellucida]|uniref:15086_t:CDS:1 n=1 Tax=Cetraspora pellucida TaxID=1433469 RepID=A0ACA9MLT9_9GLOM|nr:15086_t:CDS:2 [Cetraspora pellucida]
MEDFVSILETMKNQNIENFKNVIDISNYTTPIDPKEIVLSIVNNILETINFKFNFGVKEIINNLGVKATEIGVDATYNTNKMNLELYSVLAEKDGIEFPLTYMLLTTATAINDGIHTLRVIEFFDKLHYKGVNPTYIMTNKNSAQILAAKSIWPNAHIQLCFWHLKRTIKRQLSLSKKPKITQYSAEEANNEFFFIDLDFYPEINKEDEINQPTHFNSQSQNKKVAFTFCSSEHHNPILNLIAKHFNQHPFILIFDNQYYSLNQIQNELDKLFSDEINEELAETIQEYKENENENINHTIVEESDEAWEEVNNSAENAMSGMIKMLKKCEKLKNKRTLPRTWKDNDEQTMFYRSS